MHVELPLAQMTVQEKLQLIEVIWADISRTPEGIPVPTWHDEVLDECQRLAESGEATYVDWETAKEELRRQVK